MNRPRPLRKCQDLLEELVGEIEDEHDAEEPSRILVLPDGSIQADALISIYDLEGPLGVTLSHDLPYDTVRDFAGITPLGVAPLAMIISPAKGHKTIHDLVRHAKSKPGSINYASAGAAGQLNSERFRISAGFEIGRAHV